MKRKARDIMTRPVAICEPETPVAQVAKMMRDRDIGNVLVMEHGKLRGIVTDRDIIIRAVAEDQDPRQIPIRDFLTNDLLTGHPDWDLRQVSETMAKHQIRRLPIVEDGQVVGIISLGDLALVQQHKGEVSESLKKISQPVEARWAKPLQRNGVVVGTGMALLSAGALAVLYTTKSGKRIRHQLVDTNWNATALELLREARTKLEAAYAQLDGLAPKPKRKRNFFGLGF